jgi:hypothetical protein
VSAHLLTSRRALDDSVIKVVRDLVATYGDELSTNARRLENFLADVSKNHRLENAAMIAAVREGIPNELRASKQQALAWVAGDRLVQLLRDHQGLDAAVARWSVQAWAKVLDVAEVRLRTSGPSRARPRPDGLTLTDDAAAQIARLAGQARQLADALGDGSAKARALAAIASVTAMTDPAESAALLASAEHLLGSVSGETARAKASYSVANAVAATAPDRAEALIQSMKSSLLKDSALGRLAKALIEVDADRALRLAWSISHPGLRGCELTEIAVVLAAIAPDRAAGLARSLTSDYWRAEALSAVAAELAATDADLAWRLAMEAEQIARSHLVWAAGVAALAGTARTFHRLDPSRALVLFAEAEQLARAMGDDPDRTSAVGALAIALATCDADRAIALATALPDSRYGIGEIATRLAALNPGRALSLAPFLAGDVARLVDVASALAAVEPDGALRLAWSITDERAKASALTGVARNLLPVDWPRAARLLADVERTSRQLSSELDQVQVLTGIATVWAQGE